MALRGNKIILDACPDTKPKSNGISNVMSN